MFEVPWQKSMTEDIEKQIPFYNMQFILMLINSHSQHKLKPFQKKHYDIFWEQVLGAKRRTWLSLTNLLTHHYTYFRKESKSIFSFLLLEGRQYQAHHTALVNNQF